MKRKIDWMAVIPVLCVIGIIVVLFVCPPTCSVSVDYKGPFSQQASGE